MRDSLNGLTHPPHAELELEGRAPVDGGVELLAVGLQGSGVVHRQGVAALGGLIAGSRPRGELYLQARGSSF